MASRFPSKSSWRACSHGWRYWLVWVLCLCTWRGPVPVVHSHDLDAHALTENASSSWHLAEHLALCHSAESEGTGWHLHFIWPKPASGADDSPVDPFSWSALDATVSDRASLADFIAHPGDSRASEPPMTVDTGAQPVLGSPNEPALSPTIPKLIPLAPPRTRPSRVSPRIYYCVAQC